ncbi:MAG: sigma-70 family RNA polymerase sigma factor [Clostridia bacterium]|nr:sigma-70 family RNA polymerase sigma factor [Clostridia bacterium]
MDKYKDFTLEQILFAIGQHDDGAFSELLSRYTPMLHKVVSAFSSYVGSPEELFAEGCVALHSAALNYESTKANATFGLYARTCVHNRIVDFIRRNKPSDAVVDYDPDSVADESGIEAALIGREAVEKLLLAARELLSDYEYSVLMYHIQGYKTSQIACCLGRCSKSVDNAKSRIFSRLRREFGSAGDFN